MELDPVLKAGVAHFWFVTIHPFSDGTGQRCYGMSAQIQAERQQYYDLLEASQRGSVDLTRWLTWFLACLGRAITAAEQTLA